jgi:hypothetical protein
LRIVCEAGHVALVVLNVVFELCFELCSAQRSGAGDVVIGDVLILDLQLVRELPIDDLLPAASID